MTVIANTNRDVIAQRNDFLDAAKDRIDECCKCDAGWFARQAVDFDKVSVAIKAKHIATARIRIRIRDNFSVTDQHTVINIAAFEAVVPFQSRLDGRFHVQRDAAVEIGVGCEF